MSGIVLVFDGMRDMLERLVESFGNDLKIGLFTNSGPFHPYATIEDIVPATFPGYPGLLNLTYWRPPVQVSKVYSANTAQVKWRKQTNAGGEYVYGAYVTDYPGSTLLWLQEFPEVVTMIYDGDSISYQPQLACGQLSFTES